MLDPRPVGYLIGLLVAVLGITMVPPMLIDLAAGQGHWQVFAQSAIVTTLCGVMVALSCHDTRNREMSTRQAFMLTVGAWVVLPLFAALPFMLGATDARFVDALFEAMSGMTTTGSTVFTGLDEKPQGLLLWRGILQWLGGLGIIIVAMLFLPIMRVGGMQFFKSEGFDTMGKTLPRAVDISRALLGTYIALTAICALTYAALGMSGFDATVHAMTSVSTGGFSTSDQSFGAFDSRLQYAATLFMILGALPFVRLMMLASGRAGPLLRDFQVQAFMVAVAAAVAAVIAIRLIQGEALREPLIREAMFNVVSIFTGTGYGAGDVTAWGAMALVVLLTVGAIGGCTGSTGCSIKVFRYLVLLRVLVTQIRTIGHPNRVAVVRLGGKKLEPDVIESVMLMFTMFILTLGMMAVALSLTGLPFLESVTGAWTAIFNVGPAFGQMITGSGALTHFNDAAKYIMVFGMLLGRLELIVVFVVMTRAFWRG